MLQNAYFLAKIGADTAENEQHFAEILPIGRRRPVPSGVRCGDGEVARAPAREVRPPHGCLPGPAGFVSWRATRYEPNERKKEVRESSSELVR